MKQIYGPKLKVQRDAQTKHRKNIVWGKKKGHLKKKETILKKKEKKKVHKNEFTCSFKVPVWDLLAVKQCNFKFMPKPFQWQM